MFLTTVITALFVYINFKYLICFEVRNFAAYQKNISKIYKEYHPKAKGSNSYYFGFQNVTDNIYTRTETFHYLNCTEYFDPTDKESECLAKEEVQREEEMK